MARRDWKQYYGVVMFHKKLNRTFVNAPLYNSRSEAHWVAKDCRKLGFVEVLGVVGVKGKNGKIQKELWSRANIK